MTEYKRLENESHFDYGMRLIELKMENKPDDLDWQDIIELLGLNIHRDTLRKACQGEFGSYNVYKFMKEKLKDNINEDSILNRIREEKDELQKERYKLQTEKLEYNRWRREDARYELFEEKVVESIKNIKLLNMPKYRVEIKNNRQDTILPIADCHYGKEVKVYGLMGEVLNEYNPDIFQNRMWQLLNKVIVILEKENINHINLINLSDSIDGILRMSQLQSLRCGVIDASIEFADFLSKWINEASNYFAIDYYSVFGNHNELRLLNGKRNDFPHENTEKWITKYIQTILRDNPNVNIHYNKSPLVYTNIVGTNILAAHGQDEKNLEKSLKDYTILYNQPIDILLTGHLHSSHEKTIGMNEYSDIEFIQCPSLVGIDDFSMRIKKSSKPSAKFMILEEDVGRVNTYRIGVD